jgi:hypothetical protein
MHIWKIKSIATRIVYNILRRYSCQHNLTGNDLKFSNYLIKENPKVFIKRCLTLLEAQKTSFVASEALCNSIKYLTICAQSKEIIETHLSSQLD